MTRLDPAARTAGLASLPAWTYDPAREAITRDLRFADFDEAFAFMTRVALEATRLDHHPEWSNVYNRVHILLRTHECDGLSQGDLDLAARIDRIAA